MLAITNYSGPALGSEATRSAPRGPVERRHSAVSCSLVAVAREEISDEALVRAISEGDRRAMQTLYSRHNVRVYRYTLRLTNDAALAEDLVADVFIDVWRQAGRFRAKSQVETWLLAIARNKAISALRRRSHIPLDDDMAITIADPADDPETMAEKSELRATVQKSLSQLPRLQREVIDLAYYHEKSIDEVAYIVGAPASTVKTRMFYARKRMEKLLASAGLEGA
jgi:RNA polymerase sigma-70 factor (ECF subfamily)